MLFDESLWSDQKYFGLKSAAKTGKFHKHKGNCYQKRLWIVKKISVNRQHPIILRIFFSSPNNTQYVKWPFLSVLVITLQGKAKITALLLDRTLWNIQKLMQSQEVLHFFCWDMIRWCDKNTQQMQSYRTFWRPFDVIAMSVRSSKQSYA